MGLDEEILGEETAIDMSIDSAIYDFLAKRHKIYADIQVTDLVYCPRKAYFEKKYGKQNNNSEWSLFVGILLHDILLRSMGEYLDGDVEVLTVEVFEYHGRLWKVYGMCDLLTNKYIIELKTCGRLPDKPKPSHLMQLEAYLRFFNREYGYLVYIERHYGKRRIFKHYRNDELYDEFLNRLYDFTHALITDFPPLTKDESLCKFGNKKCPYYDICHST